MVKSKRNDKLLLDFIEYNFTEKIALMDTY